MARSLTIQTRVDEQMFENIHKVCELRGQTMAEYLRNAIRDALANEKEVYKTLLKQNLVRKKNSR